MAHKIKRITSHKLFLPAAGLFLILLGVSASFTYAQQAPTQGSTVSFPVAVNGYPSDPNGRLTNVYVSIFTVTPVSRGNYQGVWAGTKLVQNASGVTFDVTAGSIVNFVAFKDYESARAWESSLRTFFSPPYRNFSSMDGVTNRLCQINYLDTQTKMQSNGSDSCANSISLPLDTTPLPTCRAGDSAGEDGDYNVCAGNKVTHRPSLLVATVSSYNDSSLTLSISGMPGNNTKTLTIYKGSTSPIGGNNGYEVTYKYTGISPIATGAVIVITSKVSTPTPSIPPTTGGPDKTLTVGEKWDLGNGITVTAQSIDARTNPRQAWLVVQRGTTKLDDAVVAVGQTYSYPDPAKGQPLVFKTKIFSIFSGATSDAVQFSETFISPTPAQPTSTSDPTITLTASLLPDPQSNVGTPVVGNSVSIPEDSAAIQFTKTVVPATYGDLTWVYDQNVLTCSGNLKCFTRSQGTTRVYAFVRRQSDGRDFFSNTITVEVTAPGVQTSTPSQTTPTCSAASHIVDGDGDGGGAYYVCVGNTITHNASGLVATVSSFDDSQVVLSISGMPGNNTTTLTVYKNGTGVSIEGNNGITLTYNYLSNSPTTGARISIYPTHSSFQFPKVLLHSDPPEIKGYGTVTVDAGTPVKVWREKTAESEPYKWKWDLRNVKCTGSADDVATCYVINPQESGSVGQKAVVDGKTYYAYNISIYYNLQNTTAVSPSQPTSTPAPTPSQPIPQQGSSMNTPPSMQYAATNASIKDIKKLKVDAKKGFQFSVLLNYQNGIKSQMTLVSSCSVGGDDITDETSKPVKFPYKKKYKNNQKNVTKSFAIPFLDSDSADTLNNAPINEDDVMCSFELLNDDGDTLSSMEVDITWDGKKWVIGDVRDVSGE